MELGPEQLDRPGAVNVEESEAIKVAEQVSKYHRVGWILLGWFPWELKLDRRIVRQVDEEVEEAATGDGPFHLRVTRVGQGDLGDGPLHFQEPRVDPLLDDGFRCGKADRIFGEQVAHAPIGITLKSGAKRLPQRLPVQLGLWHVRQYRAGILPCLRRFGREVGTLRLFVWDWGEMAVEGRGTRVRPQPDIGELMSALAVYRTARLHMLESMGLAVSNRDPLTEFGEVLVAAHLDGTLARSRVEPGYDIVYRDDGQKKKVQVKTLSNRSSGSAGAWVNEHEIRHNGGADKYAIVVFEDFKVEGVLMITMDRLDGLYDALKKRHKDRGKMLWLTRANWNTIRGDPERFKSLGVEVWRPPQVHDG